MAANIKKRASNWLLTLNQKEGESLPDAEEWLQALFTSTKATYVVGQLEAGNDTERPHIQAYGNWHDKIAFAALKRFSSTVNLREVKIDNGVRDYCMKEDTRVAGPWEFGKRPMMRNSKTDWADCLQSAKQGEFDKIPPGILLRNYGNIQKIYKDACPVVDSEHLRGIYIYGKAGIGKSTLARRLFLNQSIYYKNHNKWFDGYKDEPVIIWDDLGLDHPKLFSNYFKIWTDRYGCRGEVKGGVLPLNHKYFIFTSQYSLETMFPDQETYDAISRRCFVYHMEFYQDLGFRTIFSIPEMHEFHKGQTIPDIDEYIYRGDGLDRSVSKVMIGLKEEIKK